MRRTVPLACLATIAVADWAILRRRPRWLLIGVFDEPAHVATNALVLANLPRRSRAWVAGFLAGSVLPDLDHVPLALADEHPTADDPRPFSHTLAALVPLALLPSAAARGAAAGALAHLARDLAHGGGTPLLWPLSDRQLKAPYALYAVGVTWLAARASRCPKRSVLPRRVRERSRQRSPRRLPERHRTRVRNGA